MFRKVILIAVLLVFLVGCESRVSLDLTESNIERYLSVRVIQTGLNGEYNSVCNCDFYYDLEFALVVEPRSEEYKFEDAKFDVYFITQTTTRPGGPANSMASAVFSSVTVSSGGEARKVAVEENRLGFTNIVDTSYKISRVSGKVSIPDTE